jgi:hypothetical protein
MRNFTAFFFVFVFASGQNIDTGNRRKVRPAISCAAPAMTHRWMVSANTNTCSGGTACTNGAGIDTVTDLGSAPSSAAEQPTSANRPVFAAALLNGKAVATFTGASQNFILHNNISDGLMTVYAVLRPTSGTFFGGGNTGTIGSVQYFFNGTNEQFNNMNKAVIVTGTSTLSTGSFQTIALTYDFTSGAAQLFRCSGGTCTNDGTGSYTGGFGNPITRIGGESVPGYFTGQLAEVGYTNVISTAGIAAYSQCQYGI